MFSKMIDVYQQVESVLLLPERPASDPLPKDYRSSGGTEVSLSQETRAVIRDARRIQHFLTDLLEDEPEVPLSRFDIQQMNMADGPEDMADLERRRFRVSIDLQESWNPKDSFEEWRFRVQERGVVVLLKSMPWTDCRGLSVWDETLVPVVVVNSRDTVTARSFTLFHEYAHLALRRAGVCLTESSQTVKGQVERWCNAFAAAFLVPAEVLRDSVNTMFPHFSEMDWLMKDVQRLANKFRVSRYVMARRLKELNFTDFYDRHFNELRAFDKQPERKQKKPGGVRPEVKRLSEVGTGVATLVLEAWNRNSADVGEVSDVLGLKRDQLEGFEEHVEDKRQRRSA